MENKNKENCSFCGKLDSEGKIECDRCGTTFCDRCDSSYNGEIWDEKFCPDCLKELLVFIGEHWDKLSKKEREMLIDNMNSKYKELEKEQLIIKIPEKEDISKEKFCFLIENGNSSCKSVLYYYYEQYKDHFFNQICWLCKKKFEKGDLIGDFLGFTHMSCFDKQQKENEIKVKLEKEKEGC